MVWLHTLFLSLISRQLVFNDCKHFYFKLALQLWAVVSGHLFDTYPRSNWINRQKTDRARISESEVVVYSDVIGVYSV